MWELVAIIALCLLLPCYFCHAAAKYRVRWHVSNKSFELRNAEAFIKIHGLSDQYREFLK